MCLQLHVSMSMVAFHLKIDDFSLSRSAHLFIHLSSQITRQHIYYTRTVRFWLKYALNNISWFHKLLLLLLPRSLCAHISFCSLSHTSLTYPSWWCLAFHILLLADAFCHRWMFIFPSILLVPSIIGCSKHFSHAKYYVFKKSDMGRIAQKHRMLPRMRWYMFRHILAMWWHTQTT